MKRHGHGVFVVTRGFHFRNMHMHCVQNIFDADLISSDIGGNNVMGIDDVTDERSSNGFCGSVIIPVRVRSLCTLHAYGMLRP